MKSALLLIVFTFISIDVFGADVEVSVMVGDSVTLHNEKQIQTEDVINWHFKQKPIATINEGSIVIKASDVEFRGRLQPDNQTGDLKIRNIKTTDSGDYQLEITRIGGSPKKTFNVRVLPADPVKKVTVMEVTVMEEDSVTLQADPTDIQRYNIQKYVVTQWRFQHQMLYNQTGSLTIKNIGTNQSGLYEAEISITRGSYTVHYTQSFNLTVRDDVKSVSVMEGDSVTLHTGFTEIQRDEIRWTFENEFIADLNTPVNEKWPNIRLNPQTGDLIISNIRGIQSGDYKVEIKTRRMILHRKYHITVIDAVKSVSQERDSVNLHIVTKIQNNDLIHWMFGDTVIAEFNKTAQRFYTSAGHDKRFTRRLELDHQTGSLTITNTKTTDSGDYELKISSSRFTINRRITVTVTGSDRNSGPGLFPGAVAVIVVVLVAAGIVAG